MSRSSTSCRWAPPRWRGCSASRRSRRPRGLAAAAARRADRCRRRAVRLRRGPRRAARHRPRPSVSGSGSRWSVPRAPEVHAGSAARRRPPAAHRRVTVGGVGLVELPLADLRGHVALVTQEHHVFVGTLRENLALAAPRATDADCGPPRRGRRPGVGRCPARRTGHGGRFRWPRAAGRAGPADRAGRIVLADPHTLVLDEATSLIDPRAARHLERSLAAVSRAARSSRSRTGCSPRTTPTGWRSSRTA